VSWALGSLAGTFAGAALLYCLCYRRALFNSNLNRAIRPPNPSLAFSILWNLFAKWVFRNPQERALFEFMGKTLCRSRLHQLYFLGYLGAGFAFVIRELSSLVLSQGWESLQHSTMTLRAIPLGFTFFVLAGIRLIYTVPVDLPANWIFQITDGAKYPLSVIAPRKAVLYQILLPVQFFFFIVSIVLQGWLIALPELGFNLLLALLLLEGLFLRWNRVPFASAYQPGKAKIQVLWPFYWALFFSYSFTMAALESRLLQHPTAYLVVCGSILLAIWGTRSYALSQQRIFRYPAYDDDPNPTIQLLNLEY
jgi:hypothetical protein